MGGIKNKLSKLSNKVKVLLSSLSLTERADERSSSGEVKTNKTKGSRLPSFSQSSKMPDGQISNTRKLSHLGLYAEKTIGSLRPTSQSLPLAKGRQMSVAHRWGRITKYLGIACLTLAILSTLVLNIISSYSNSSTRSNAEPVSNNSPSTLANTANTELDPTGISISISSYPSKTEETALVNEGISNLSNARIEPIAGKYNASGETGLRNILASESNNTWAYAIDAHSVAGVIETGYVAPLPSTNTPDIILSNNGNNATTTNVYYGAKVEHPEQLLAGDYTADVVYTVVAELMPEPEVNSTIPNVYKIDSIKKIQLVEFDLYALMSSGTVYQYKYGSISQFFKLDSRIVDFATYNSTGFSSMVAVASNGQVYSFGANDYGQLGDGTTVDADKSSPVNITSSFGQTVKKVFAGDYYYGALTDDGHVYMWGYGGKGNLGTGNSSNQATPIDITANFSTIDGSIINIVPTHDSRSAITFALTDTGHVYGWGYGRNGALGTGDGQIEYYEYYPVDITPNFNLDGGETIIQVAADGGNGNYGHGLALTDRGRVFTWGDNRYGELGDGSTTNSYLPKDITGNFELTGDDKIISIGAGINQSYAVSANGVVYRWGRDGAMVPTVISGDSKFVNMNTDSITFAAGYRPSTFLLDGNNNVYTVVSATSSSSAAGQNITDRFMAKPLTTLTGSNFTNVDNVYIDLNRDGAMQSNEQCTDLTVNSDTELTCNVPTDSNIATGDYTMYIETPYNYTTTTFRYENYAE